MSESEVKVVLAEIDGLVKSEDAKKVIREAAASAQAPHLAVIGGNTALAGKLAKLFKAAGLLPEDKVIESNRAGLVGGFIGQSGMLVAKACDAASGGVLFIEEAATISSGDMLSKEAVDALLKRMEDGRGKFAVILSDEKDRLKSFLNATPGLKSRFRILNVGE
jgi:hypothetical protein